MVRAKLLLDSVHRRALRDPDARRALDGRLALWRELLRVPFASEVRAVHDRRVA
jgi:hypothetical protein